MEDVMREMTAGELGALCSNLQKACTKQLRSEEAQLFEKLALYYQRQEKRKSDQDFSQLLNQINADLTEAYTQANEAAKSSSDRGALRALVWGEKVSKLLKGLLTRYEKQKNGLLENTNVYVCEICGFVYVGDAKPEICPICKVPGFKIHPIQKEAI